MVLTEIEVICAYDIAYPFINVENLNSWYSLFFVSIFPSALLHDLSLIKSFLPSISFPSIPFYYMTHITSTI